MKKTKKNKPAPKPAEPKAYATTMTLSYTPACIHELDDAEYVILGKLARLSYNNLVPLPELLGWARVIEAKHTTMEINAPVMGPLVPIPETK